MRIDKTLSFNLTENEANLLYSLLTESHKGEESSEENFKKILLTELEVFLGIE